MLTQVAHAELDHLLSVLQGIRLHDAKDVRRLTNTNKPFSTRDAYEALSPTLEVQDFHGAWIWRSKVPNKVKIFGWLFFKDRLNTKANLLHKNIMENAICHRCSHPDEDKHHVIFSCDTSHEVWQRIGLSAISATDDINLWVVPAIMEADSATWPSVLLTLLWRLWDARNGTIFRGETHHWRSTVSRVCDDLTSWEGRFVSGSMVPGLRRWKMYLRSCMDQPTSSASARLLDH